MAADAEAPPGLLAQELPQGVLTTNTLRVQFDQAPLSVAKAYEVLALFGEVSRLELPPGEGSTAVVSYYDVRSAAAASAALPGQCSEEPQYGNRTLSLDGDMQLQTWMLPEIFSVRPTGGDQTFLLEFFDIRSREHAAEQFQKMCGDQEPKEGCPKFLPVPVDLPPDMPAYREDGFASDGPVGPRYRTDLTLSKVNWDELSSGLEKRTTLRLRCLPGRLCHEEALNSLLTKASLVEAVDCLRVFPGEGKRPGSALINVKKTSSVAAVAKLFHGKQWGMSPTPVAVSFAAVQGKVEVCKAYPTQPALCSKALNGLRTKVPDQIPRRIEAGELLSSGDEGSTEAGDSVSPG